MPTSYTVRTSVTTAYSGRLQGAFLCDVHGNRICDVHGNRIVVLSRNGTMPVNITQYTVRPTI